MKFNNTKIEKVCAKANTGRPAIEQPFYDATHGRILATNGHILVSLPVESGDTDISAPVPVEAIKAARACDKTAIILEEDSISWKAASGHTVAIPYAPEFPDVDRVIPEPHSNSKLKLGIDAKLLIELADAMRSYKPSEPRHLTLSFSPDANGCADFSGAIRVTARTDDDVIGVIMPVRID